MELFLTHNAYLNIIYQDCCKKEIYINNQKNISYDIDIFLFRKGKQIKIYIPKHVENLLSIINEQVEENIKRERYWDFYKLFI